MIGKPGYATFQALQACTEYLIEQIPYYDHLMRPNLYYQYLIKRG